MDPMLLIICVFIRVIPAFSTKPYSTGQRIFTDAEAIDFIDPSKHGFHIVLREDFVSTHLQPVHAPTVYASAIALQQPSTQPVSLLANRSNIQPGYQSGNGHLRATKILYPENGNPDDGLLDGRMIKLLGLREKTWYYVCVEYESNLRRHELVTGMNCQLKRTLDKFGQSAESTVNEVAVIEVTDRSIAVQLSVSTDFPTFLHVYLSPDSAMSAAGATPPAQTFLARPMQGQNQRLRVYFGSFLQPDSSYGKLCVIEEPTVRVYTAMGRAIRQASENCYFTDLKTKPGLKAAQARKIHHELVQSPHAQARSHQIGMARVFSSAAAIFLQPTSLITVIVIQLCWFAIA